MSYPNNFGAPMMNNNGYNPYPRPVVIVTNQYGVQVHQGNEQLPHHQQQPSTQLGVDEANQYSRRQYNKKNRPQSNAITPACMIATTAGIHFSYIYFYIKWYDPLLFPTDLMHHLLSWFIGLAIGAFLSCLLARTIQKITFNYFAIILTIVSGIMFTSNTGYTSILIARFLAGFSYGLILIPVLMHAGEISVKKLRGELVSNVHICFISGVLLGVIFYTVSQKSTMDIYQLCGIGILVFSVAAFILNTFLTIESPLYLMDRANEIDAFSSLLKLRKEKFETVLRRQEFNDLKEMFSEDKTLSTSPIIQRNLRPLLVLGMLRGIYALSTSIPLNYRFNLSVQDIISPDWIELVVLARLFGEIISWYMIDRKGRRHILRASMILIGVCAILAGIQYTEHIRILDVRRFNFILNTITFFYQFFLGLGLGTVSLTYMAEAFPFVKKSNSLLLIIIFENLIHVITIIIFIKQYYSFNYAAFFYIIGSLSIIYSLFIFKFLPETKNLTLRQCRNMMR